MNEDRKAKREEELARQLRANLRRRKAAQKERKPASNPAQSGAADKEN
jgi:hypothetical protein